MPSLNSRDISPDDTINIAFGLASLLIGIVTIMFGWLMWKLKQRRAIAKSTDEDDSELLSTHICDVRRIVHNKDGFEVTLRLGRRICKKGDEFH